MKRNGPSPSPRLATWIVWTLAARAIKTYVEAKPKAKHGEHVYTLGDVGLDEASVRATFADYVAHYDISEERP